MAPSMLQYVFSASHPLGHQNPAETNELHKKRRVCGVSHHRAFAVWADMRGWYHAPALRTSSRAGLTNRSSRPVRHAGGVSLPTPTMVLPLPVMKTAEKHPSASNWERSAANSGNLWGKLETALLAVLY